MGIKISIKGLNKVNKYFVELPRNLSKNIGIAQQEFCSFVQKSAKLRAPRSKFHYLADSIIVTPLVNNQISVEVNAPEAVFQEFGFTPHMIFPNMTDRHGNKLSTHGFTHPVWASGKAQPFIGPALEMGLSKLPNMLSNATKNALGSK